MRLTHDVRLGQIQGKLEAFAMASMAVNEVYAFTFEPLKAGESLEESVRIALDLEAGVEPNSLQIAAAPQIEDELRDALNTWLFTFPTHCAVQEEENRQFILDDLIAALTRLAPTIYRVNFSPVRFYECAWDDFVLQGEQGAYFLHLGFSD